QKVGALGFGIRNYGIAQVSSFLTSNLAYARSFGGVFSSSISANYHRYYVENYISDNAFSLNLGGLIRFSESVNVGFVFRNATFSKFKDDTEQYLPAELGAGFLYKISKDLSLEGDCYYELEQGVNIRGGLAYSVAEIIILRAGASSNPMQYFGGIGLVWNKFQFDVSSSFHTRLGSSPQIALAYAF
ncbi:MAG: DNA-binding protein, partial [Sphingobacterium composti]